jgi:hypothetical protein
MKGSWFMLKKGDKGERTCIALPSRTMPKKVKTHFPMSLKTAWTSWTSWTSQYNQTLTTWTPKNKTWTSWTSQYNQGLTLEPRGLGSYLVDLVRTRWTSCATWTRFERGGTWRTRWTGYNPNPTRTPPTQTTFGVPHRSLHWALHERSEKKSNTEPTPSSK